MYCAAGPMISSNRALCGGTARGRSAMREYCRSEGIYGQPGHVVIPSGDGVALSVLRERDVKSEKTELPCSGWKSRGAEDHIDLQCAVDYVGLYISAVSLRSSKAKNFYNDEDQRGIAFALEHGMSLCNSHLFCPTTFS